MDGTGKFDPGEDVAFFMQRAKQFEGFAKSIQKGDYSFDALAALDEIRDRLERFKPLVIIHRVANLCADLPPLDIRVVKGKKTEVKIRKDELVAHWQLAYFWDDDIDEARLHIDEDQLQEDAERIIRDELDRLSKKFLQAQEKKAEAESHVQKVPDWHPDRQKALKASIQALDAFQKARAELLDLIGAKEQQFNPEPEEPYVTQWRDNCLRHYASLGINYGRGGLKPNAEEVRNRRLERGWKQNDLVTAIREATGTDINVRTIRRVEAGSPVDAKTLLVVATALEVDIQTLIIPGAPAEYHNRL